MQLDFIKYVDVIVDGEFISELKDNKLHWRGSSNQRVIDVKKSIDSGHAVLYSD
ncbi:MAG TPA: anaerobic ribonucleoside-triphosphate reductase activating protein, partial [Ruminococcus sp.]|nr:anaerobic ribonucleoside-triphosphate reductase activating protein [Ruminococcus sp.]